MSILINESITFVLHGILADYSVEYADRTVCMSEAARSAGEKVSN